MAGMLPGVECARRRRFHQGDSLVGTMKSSIRRSSFCLYASSHDSHLNTNNWHVRPVTTAQSFQAENLGDVAREAKGRLDERLRGQRKLDMMRQKSRGSAGDKNDDCKNWRCNSSASKGSLQRDSVFGGKKRLKSWRRFSWSTLGWKAREQDEDSAICLERFEGDHDLWVLLPCTHRFHSSCLLPWLENNAHCPCCRTQIIFSS